MNLDNLNQDAETLRVLGIRADDLQRVIDGARLSEGPGRLAAERLANDPAHVALKAHVLGHDLTARPRPVFVNDEMLLEYQFKARNIWFPPEEPLHRVVTLWLDPDGTVYRTDGEGMVPFATVAADALESRVAADAILKEIVDATLSGFLFEPDAH